MEEDILNYLCSKYPEEGCGIILNVRGKLKWVPCENTAEDKLNTFKIASKDFVASSMSGDIFAIVHSHPNESPEPSEGDKKASNFLQIPYHIYSIPSKEKYIHTPIYSSEPLLGRVYEFGKNDCWTLVRDYYKQKLNIVLPMLEFEDNFYNKGINYFEDFLEPWGGIVVDTPQVGDIIYFNIENTIPNHCGVYLGNDLFMHHSEHRLSCRDSLPRWDKYIRSFVRSCKMYT